MVITRRVTFLAVTVLLLAGAGIAAAATRDPVDDEVTAAAAPETTTTEPARPSTSTTSTATSTSTTVVTSTTTTRRATTTTTRRPVATTAAPQPTSTAAPAPTCTAAQIHVTATASRPSYGPGENAEVTTVLRNRSSSSCSYTGYTVEVTFRDSAGAAFGGSTIVADNFRPVPLAAGATLTHTEAWRHIFQPAGPRTGTATWQFAGNRYDATASFQLM